MAFDDDNNHCNHFSYIQLVKYMQDTTKATCGKGTRRNIALCNIHGLAIIDLSSCFNVLFACDSPHNSSMNW